VTPTEFIRRRGYDPADFEVAPQGGPAVAHFPVLIPEGFEPSDSDGDGPDLRWDRKVCPGQNVEDGYRPRWGGGFYSPRGKHLHAAIDIMAAEGAIVQSVSFGYVPVRIKVGREVRPGAGTSPKGGNYVFVRDVRGWEWYFAHLRDVPLVEPGAEVKPGEQLGFLGRTGNASRTYGGDSRRGCPHLHLRLGWLLSSGNTRKYDARGPLASLYDSGAWRACARVSG